MSSDVQAVPLSSRAEAAQALGLMSGALILGAMFAQESAGLVLGIISFCLFLMTLIAGSLLLLEGRIVKDRPDPTLKFCIPAVGLLGVCGAFAVAGGHWTWATVVLVVAFGFAAYRRAAMTGAFNLIPAAALDVGVVAGVGASGAGLVLALASFFLI